MSKAYFESVDIAREFVNTALQSPELAQQVNDFAENNRFQYDLSKAYIISYGSSAQQTVVIPSSSKTQSKEEYKLAFFLENGFVRDQPIALLGGLLVKSQISPVQQSNDIYSLDFYSLGGKLVAETTYDAANDYTMSAHLIQTVEKGWWDDFIGSAGHIIGSFDDGGLGTVAGLGCLFDSPLCGAAIVGVCGVGATYVNWCGSCGEVCYSCIPHP